MNCGYQSRVSDRGQFLCGLGWYGGRPWVKNCLDCIKRGHNTPEAKAAFAAKADQTHPAHRQPISGCCDRADQS
jgi:hypothetical protein